MKVLAPSMRLGLLGLVLFWVGCAEEVSRPAIVASYTHAEAGDDADSHDWIVKNCPFGKPVLKTIGNFGPTETLYRQGYVLQVSNRDKIPLWVCEGFTQQQLHGGADRANSTFLPDPDQKGPKATNGDYALSGYDRGHQAPAADFKSSQTLMDECHYLSNMAPQVGIGFNRSVWASLEDRVRQLCPTHSTGDATHPDFFIITGPMFYDPINDTPHATGVVKHKVIGPGKVAVPTHFYKIVIGKDDAGHWECIAFFLQNKKYPNGYDFTHDITTVHFIEDHTGVNFMPDLDGGPNATLHDELENHAGHLWR